MIRVLHIVSGMGIGGIQTKLMNIYRNIDRNQVQFDYLIYNRENYYEPEIKELGGRIYKIAPLRKGLLKNKRDFDAFFRDYGKDYAMVHAHLSNLSNINGLIAAKKYGVKTIIAHSRNSSALVWHHRLLHRINSYRLDEFISHKFAVSDKAGKWLFGEKSEFTILPNALDTKLFSYSEETRRHVRDKYSWNNKFVIGHVGRFVRQKNHTFLLDVFASVHRIDRDSILILIGEGSLEPAIKEKISSLRIQDSVYFLGVGMPIHEVLQGMDVFCFPSFYEGWPNVVLEAQASGLRVIASDEITKSINITGLVDFVSLRESPEYWAQKVSACREYTRRNTSTEIKEAGYDNDENIKWLESFYLSHAAKDN